MENVGKIVNDVLDARGWRGKVLERLAVELWPEVVGEPISHHTMAERFAGGTLYVRARSPQWTHELHFLEARIITRLNGRLKQPIVQKIRCNVTTPRGVAAKKIKADWEDPTFPAVPPQSRAARDHMDDEAARRAQSIVAEIEDDDMRRVMGRLIASVMRAQKDKDIEGPLLPIAPRNPQEPPAE